ncbi:MAG: hypothetical protein HY043_17215 [Verrucomicrobia bacterium]|nr:hypothetical protein [Verrucomicrobiota bacterium]
MKSKLWIIGWLLLALNSPADPFINLDFELANTNNVVVQPGGACVSGVGTVTDLLPGWTILRPGYTNNDTLNLNIIPQIPWLDSAPSCFLISRECRVPVQDVDAGKYSLVIRSTLHPIIFSQTGDVPVEADELRIFVLDKFRGATALRVSLNGTPVIYFTNDAQQAVIRGDISGFGGTKNVKLDLEVMFTDYLPFYTSEQVGIDNIVFAKAEKLPPHPDVPRDFQNLGLDTIQLSPAGPDGFGGQLTNVTFPGWSFLLGANQFSKFGYSCCACIDDCPQIILCNLQSNRYYNSFFTNFLGTASADFVEGAYAIYFHQDYVNDHPFALVQTGIIPSSARFLRFKAGGWTSFTVTLNGETPPVVDSLPVLETTRPWEQPIGDVFAGRRKTFDISAYAGKNIELRFTAGYSPSTNFFQSGSDGILDSIEFLPAYARFIRPVAGADTNGFKLSWVSSPSSKFQVESSTNFFTNWQSLGEPVVSASTNFFFTDITVTNLATSQRFYRLRALP